MTGPVGYWHVSDIKKSLQLLPPGPLFGSRRLPRMLACLTEQLEHLPIERWDIVGLAARHEIVIDHDLPIHPLRAGIAKIGLE